MSVITSDYLTGYLPCHSPPFLFNPILPVNSYSPPPLPLTETSRLDRTRERENVVNVTQFIRDEAERRFLLREGIPGLPGLPDNKQANSGSIKS